MPWKKDSVMRISLWPVLVCGLVLAGTVGQTTRAAEPADRFSGFSPAYNADGDEDESEEYESAAGYEAAGAGGPYFQPVQYVDDGSGGMPMYGMDPYAGQDYPPNVWPQVSPYEHRMQGVANDGGGLWQYNESDERAIWLGSVEFLITWGLRPGTQLVGSGGPPSDQYFFPGNQNIFPHQTTNVFPNITHYGVRARYGWENPDGSGFILSGFYVAEANESSGPVGVHQFPLGSTIQNVASIPYSVGNGGGELVTFDTNFQMRYGQEAWGADGDYYMAPFFSRNSFKLGVSVGAKYLRVSESLHIRAQDSSLSYDVSPTGVISNIQDTGLPPLDTNIVSQTLTDLVGPSVGLKYEMGGKKFKIWGQTKVAVAANIEEMRVFGQNAISFSELASGIQPPVTFDTSRSHTRISPILDTSIYGEFPLFAMLPIFNKITLINRANFRIGWNYILVGEMSRPANIIQYNLNEPTVRTNRTWFSLSTLSFAIDWRF